MNITEKLDYIDKDFKKLVVDDLGEIPEDKAQAVQWYGKYINLESKWCEKYENNSLCRYAYKLAALFNDRCEYIYHDRFGSFGNVDFRKYERGLK